MGVSLWETETSVLHPLEMPVDFHPPTFNPPTITLLHFKTIFSYYTPFPLRFQVGRKILTVFLFLLLCNCTTTVFRFLLSDIGQNPAGNPQRRRVRNIICRLWYRVWRFVSVSRMPGCLVLVFCIIDFSFLPSFRQCEKNSLFEPLALCYADGYNGEKRGG